MKMFKVHNPDTIEETLKLKNQYKKTASYNAGGTDNLVRWKEGIGVPENVISINKINELKVIKENESGEIEIGACATYGDIIRSVLLNKKAKVLVYASKEVGAVQIRNMGTIGGNIANASPAGDALPALYVLNASIKLRSIEGERVVKAGDFFKAPGKTDMNDNEIIEKVIFSPLDDNYKSFFLKVGPRRALAISKISAAGVLKLESDGRVSDVRLALGAAAPTIIRIKTAEEYLNNKILNEDTLKKVQNMASEAATPITDIRSTDKYRKHVAGVLVRRGLEEL